MSQGRQPYRHIRRLLYALLILVLLAALFLLILLIRERLIEQMGKMADDTAQESLPTVDYDAEADIALNLRALRTGVEPAEVVSRGAQAGKKVSLHIDGMMDAETMEEILLLVQAHDIDVMFFPSGMQAAEEPEVARAIAEAGYAIGNYGLREATHLEKLSQQKLVESLTNTNKILESITGNKPDTFKAGVTEYTDSLLRAVRACGLSRAVQSTEYLTYHSFQSLEEAQAYVNNLAYESIISVKLSGKLDESEYSPKNTAAPARDKAPGLATNAPEREKTDKERTLDLIRWLLISIENAQFSEESVALRAENGGALAEPVHNLYSTQPAVGYAFFGIGRVHELIGILDAIKKNRGAATFFVTADEIEAYPEQLKQIIDGGHTLGLLHYPVRDADFYRISYDLLRARDLLAQYGQPPRLVLQAWGDIGAPLREAVSAMGCQLIQCDTTYAREANQSALTANQVVTSVYGANAYGMMRGRIYGFRMNFHDRAGLLGELLLELQASRNPYRIEDIYLMINDEEHLFEFPLPEERILPEVHNRLFSGQSPADFIEYAQGHYIGNPDINTKNQLPDFSSDEIRKLDKKGRIPNDEKMAFLTFDDWGTDVGITKLLTVLRRHNVKATFFVRSRYVTDNPSLLRAIAMDGHEIASHTHNHLPLAHDPDGKWKFTPLTSFEAVELKQDIILSYQTLERIVGDILLENGKPALSTLFRPPTMAISKIGMEAVFDCGISTIVNGDYTSRDYMATSAESLAKELSKNIRSGSVVILHMSDNSVYTAEALDLYLAENAEKSDKNRLNFARLSDYLLQSK